MSTLTYPEVGATRLGPLPKGYNHLHHRTRVGRGAADFAAAGAAVTEWRMHRASGTRVDARPRGRSPVAGSGWRSAWGRYAWPPRAR